MPLIKWPLIFLISLVFLHCPSGASESAPNRRKTSVKVESNNLEIEFSVERPRIKNGDEFLAKAVFTNRSERILRLNTLFLEFAPILIKTRTADGTPVNPTSPPFPPEDDGNVGRVDLDPGRSVEFWYRGVDLFGVPLAKGKYQVRFRYDNPESRGRDWIGAIETGWVEFEVSEK